MKPTFQHVFRIYKSDILNIVSNWVVAVIVGGLIFLPSLYAWLNIYASMDPYAHTANMKIAVVNEDDGTTIKGENLNIGKELMSNLQANNSFSWYFLPRKEALDSLNIGDYFAVLIVPNDFSEKLTSILTDQPTKAHIDYYVNEKINPIAPKITGKGAGVITQQVSSEFISTVNGTLFSMFNTIGIEIEHEIPDFKKFEHYIFTIEQHLPDIESFLAQTAKGGKDAEKLLDTTISEIPEIEKMTTSGLTTIHNGLQLINEADTLFTQLSPIVKADLESVQTIAQRFSQLLEQLQTIQTDTATLAKSKDELQKQLTSSQDKVNNSIQTLEALQKLTQADASSRKQLENSLQTVISSLQQERSNDVIALLDNKGIIQQLESIQGKLQANPIASDSMISVLSTLRQLNAVVTDVSNKVQQFNNIDEQTIKKDIAAVQQTAQDAANHLNQFLSYYSDKLEPQIHTTLNAAKDTLTNASTMLTKVQSSIPQAKQRLSNAKNTLVTANKAIATIQSDFPTLSKKIIDLANKLRTLENETDISEIVQLLKNDVEAERDFFEEPVKLAEHRIFPIANYGTAMTPFYTVLSIWVGCLLLISLLAVNIHDNPQYSIREIYFGRLMTFATISIIQTLIITIGDILLLDISIRAPLSFILFGLIISFVFITVVYTLVSVFGNVGKALAIVMLVLQIAGSGGTYPVELLPTFFQVINPFLPFTYAIGMMREAVGGIIWSKIWIDLTFLLSFWLVFLLFGLFLKKLLGEKMELLMNKTRGLDIFH
ncbi:YhgE/Pip domain-containing protein [Lysinibacillus sphaericus]|uniref:Phage infection protein n=1 Tax=Lysinibacillus sphaericus TaxID=1421 RepID=A0A2S0JYY2_LYSSH|nr:YhgE/Pip domain-containing protein [Lysinibacillus sphaericus]AVK96268.1 phage infection protein [Lysinibacillus sphaericus]MED4544443.1 YhgE/Pip domain-containing protein [Lysinibacillus sphaericus]TKI18054.1 YhgE/Pip domain-containing protein [Lysinibacillus sphaericus]SUV17959.1 YhgE/Pip-like protein [Lysinibacillus sphaericus]GEC84504.1 phage infection protein [Lysinibacillus sphaericus]